MQFLIPIVLIAVLVIANVTTRDIKPKVEVHASITPSATPSATTSPSLSPIPTITNTPDHTNPTTTPTPTAPSQNTTNNSNWVYPGATINNQGSGSLSLSSTDNPTTITNWYKDKIKSSGGSTTSFVTTNTNDNVLNKLAGAGGSTNVQVEIKKDSGSASTTINVTF